MVSNISGALVGTGVMAFLNADFSYKIHRNAQGFSIGHQYSQRTRSNSLQL